MALVERLGDSVPLLITVGTPAGLARAREKYAGARHVSTQPAPWDLPGATRRFIAAARPRGAVFIETELWPNLIATAHAARIPLALVSARLSARSVQRYQRWGAGLMRATVRAFAAIGAQTEDDRARFIAVGAAPAVLSVTGNLKFDVPVEGGLPASRCGTAHAVGAIAAAVGRRQHPSRARRPCCWKRTSSWRHDCATPARRGRCWRWHPAARNDSTPWHAGSTTMGIPHARTSNGAAAASSDVDVLLIDEMGRLLAWYGAADAAFVGGSLVPVGGHNLLEPAVLGRPVLTGPHVHNAPEVARSLLDAQGAVVVGDASALAAQLATWLRRSGCGAGMRRPGGRGGRRAPRRGRPHAGAAQGGVVVAGTVVGVGTVSQRLISSSTLRSRSPEARRSWIRLFR